MKNNKKAKKINEKLKEISKEKKMDLSSDQDLSLALMNLISIEEHFVFSGSKTGKNKYYDLAIEVREIRKDLLKEIVTDYEGEVWCISKHLLAGAMRLMEVGTKQTAKGNRKKANRIFDHSYSLYSLFWAVNENAVEFEDIINKDKKKEDRKRKENRFLLNLKKKVSSLVDCCRE